MYTQKNEGRKDGQGEPGKYGRWWVDYSPLLCYFTRSGIYYHHVIIFISFSLSFLAFLPHIYSCAHVGESLGTRVATWVAYRANMSS